jgi:dihydropteroate synthase
VYSFVDGQHVGSCPVAVCVAFARGRLCYYWLDTLATDDLLDCVVTVAAPTLLVRGRSIVVDSTLIMGVVNASPESFSDAARYQSLEQRLELCSELVAAGADIIDVGGQSAITNQAEVEPTEEADRVVPIIEWLHANHPEVAISVDTYKPFVARAALSAGASILNDVSGLAYPEVVDACVRSESALVIMHTRARPKVRLQDPDLYDDVTSDVVGFLSSKIEAAVAGGLPSESIIVDPGPDFTKTPYQTVAVLRRIDQVRALGRPVLLALSRKDFLGAILQRPPRGRDAGTLAAIAHLAATPGNIVRVHDVAATRDVLRTLDVLMGRRDLDPHYLLPDELRYEPNRGGTGRSAT